jgi:ribosomal protein S18 acetylase RimI-like enzyme
MEIVPASPAHISELALLFDAYRMFYRMPSDIPTAEKFLQERIEKSESVVYVALDDQEKVVGFAQLYPLFSSTRMRRLWLLNDLFVIPNQRSKGIGKRLIEKCKQLAKSTDAAGVFLETEKSNDIGNHLYPLTGFEEDIQHNYYFWVNPSPPAHAPL